MKWIRIAPIVLAFALSACGQATPAPTAASMAQEPVRAAAESRPNPVICVPGFVEPAALLSNIETHLEKSGRDVTVLKLFPNLASVEDGAEKLGKTVAEVKKRTGAQRVDLIGHSKGGLVVRYYVKFNGGTEHVERLIAVSSPNKGVPVPLPAIWRTIDQVKTGSPWMKKLNEPDQTPGDVKYTTLIGGLDPVVMPHGTSDLEGAKNHRIPRATHLSILFSKKAIAVIDEALAN